MYCSKCGAKMENTDKFCPECGTPVEGVAPVSNENNSKGTSGFYVPIKVFLIICTVAMACCSFCISLARCLPMYKKIMRAYRDGEKLTVGFKVCTLIFVSLISGILLLCDQTV